MPQTDPIPLRTATRAWAIISLQTFGGPAGQIAVMQREIVDRRGWIDQQRFLHALNYCMLLPGPEAHQLAVYIGWLLNGLRGGLIAGGLFILPGFVSLLALSAAYVGFGDTAIVTALFMGLAPAVIAIVAQALWRVSRRSLTSLAQGGVAAGAFLAIAVFGVPFPVVILAAAVVGWWVGRSQPTESSNGDKPRPLRTLKMLGVGVALWAAPTVAAVALLGPRDTLSTQGLFFSGAAIVTFGGAYAVLAYVAQEAVGRFAWLSATDMVRGLALAESTPGPLIMVVQFVAFLAAYHHPGNLNPWLAGILASLLTVWVTFVPSFLLIFLGAPYVERLRGNLRLSAALSGITSAVVGVIASLGLYFAAHTLFASIAPASLGPVRLTLPVLASFRPAAGLITAAALVMVFWLQWPVLRVLGVSAALGLIVMLLIL